MWFLALQFYSIKDAVLSQMPPFICFFLREHSHAVKCSPCLTRAWDLREGDLLTERRLAQVCRVESRLLALEKHHDKHDI